MSGPVLAPGRRAAFAGLLGVGVLGFAALGVWQVERRAWKLSLIAAVEARVEAVPVAAPGPGAWGGVAAGDAYSHVRVEGAWLPGPPIRVQALTELGAGWWWLAPLRTAAGWTVLVNRGFVPSDGVGIEGAAGLVAVSGLLRLGEPGGGFLRSNDPAADQWVSRDVGAIAAARGLGMVAPYFIDADAAGSGGYPRGGMTVVRFTNNHLVYALTWFSLCGLSLVGLVRVLRRGR